MRRGGPIVSCLVSVPSRLGLALPPCVFPCSPSFPHFPPCPPRPHPGNPGNLPIRETSAASAGVRAVACGCRARRAAARLTVECARAMEAWLATDVGRAATWVDCIGLWLSLVPAALLYVFRALRVFLGVPLSPAALESRPAWTEGDLGRPPAKGRPVCGARTVERAEKFIDFIVRRRGGLRIPVRPPSREKRAAPPPARRARPSDAPLLPPPLALPMPSPSHRTPSHPAAVPAPAARAPALVPRAPQGRRQPAAPLAAAGEPRAGRPCALGVLY